MDSKLLAMQATIDTAIAGLIPIHQGDHHRACEQVADHLMPVLVGLYVADPRQRVYYGKMLADYIDTKYALNWACKAQDAVTGAGL